MELGDLALGAITAGLLGPFLYFKWREKRSVSRAFAEVGEWLTRTGFTRLDAICQTQHRPGRTTVFLMVDEGQAKLWIHDREFAGALPKGLEAVIWRPSDPRTYHFVNVVQPDGFVPRVGVEASQEVQGFEQKQQAPPPPADLAWLKALLPSERVTQLLALPSGEIHVKTPGPGQYELEVRWRVEPEPLVDTLPLAYPVLLGLEERVRSTG